MPLEVHEDTDLYTIEHDTDLDVLVHTWTGFASGEEYRSGADALLEYVEQTGVSKIIIDTRGIQAHDDADKQWLEETWVPRTIEAGVEATATVHKDSVISEMEMENLMTDVDGSAYAALMTADMDEARDWIADQ